MSTVPIEISASAGSKRFVQLVIIALQVAIVLLGHYWGAWVHYPGWTPSQYTFLGLLAVALIGFGGGSILRRSSAKVTIQSFSRAMWPLFYTVALILFEAFLFVHSYLGFVVAVIAMVPLLLNLGNQLRERHWVLCSGIALFLFTACAMTTSNAGLYESGSGFFGCWY